MNIKVISNFINNDIINIHNNVIIMIGVILFVALIIYLSVPNKISDRINSYKFIGIGSIIISIFHMIIYLIKWRIK